ncbi:MAG: hypothetical protein KK478_12550 [Ensifer alkalisoli]|nr:hypothetical protein [Sinorhizobium alkalisoli]
MEGGLERRIASESTITSHINADRNCDSDGKQRLVRTLAARVSASSTSAKIGEVRPSGGSSVDEHASNDLRGPPSALAVPDKPSITVLPFQNLSGDPDPCGREGGPL